MIRPFLSPVTRLATVAVAIILVVAIVPAHAITIKEEEDLAREFLQYVHRHYVLIDDPAIVDYVNAVGQRILKQMPPQPFTYKFYVIKEDVYNAFAIPAGHIFINSGLLAAMQSEEELAGILSHEIAHVVCRHISQRIARQSKIGLATMAGIVAGIFLGASGVSPQAANALIVGSSAAGQTAALAFSREDEMQSDQLGLGYLAEAGYRADGLLTALNRIRSKQWFGSKQIPSYLMTHPAVENRLAYVGAWVSQHPGPAGSPRVKTKPTGYSFAQINMRLRANFDEPDTAAAWFQKQLAAAPNDPVYLNGYAIALSRQGHRREAIDQMRLALKTNLLNAGMLADLGKLYFLDGQYLRALKILESAARLDPKKNFEGRFYLGRTYSKLNRYAEAVDTYQGLLDDWPDYTQAHYYLGEAFSHKGDRGLSHYHLGVFYHHRGNWKNARFHLMRARKETTDPKQRKAIDDLLEGMEKPKPKADKK